jgi:hypothetical protein
MTDDTRNPPKSATEPARRARWPTQAQLDNAKRNAARATRARHHHEPVEFDWDQAITNLKAMLDRIED